MKKVSNSNWKEARVDKQTRHVRFDNNLAKMRRSKSSNSSESNGSNESADNDNSSNSNKSQSMPATQSTPVTPVTTLQVKRNAKQIDANYVDNRCRYWIQQRIGSMMDADAFTSKSGYTFKVDVDSNAGGLCFKFMRNGVELARIDSNGYLYCSNIWMKGLNVLSLLNVVRKDIEIIEGDLSQYVKHVELKNGTYDMDINTAIMKHLEINNDETNRYAIVHTYRGNYVNVPYTLLSWYPDIPDGNWVYVYRFGKNTADYNCGNINFRYNSDGNSTNMITLGVKGEHRTVFQVLGNGQVRCRYYDFPLNGADAMKLLYEDWRFNNGEELAYSIEDNRANFKLLYKRLNDINVGQIGFYNKSAQIYFKDTGTASNDYLSIWFAADGTEQYKFYNDKCYFLPSFVSDYRDTPAIACVNNDNATWVSCGTFFAPNLTSGKGCEIKMGKADTKGNMSYLHYTWQGNNNANNCLCIGFHSYNDLFRFYRDKVLFYKRLDIEDNVGSPFRIKSTHNTPAICIGNDYSANNSAVLRYVHNTSPHHLGLGFYDNDDILTIDTDKNIGFDNQSIAQICNSTDYANNQKISDNALITSQAVKNAIAAIPTPQNIFDKTDEGEWSHTLPDEGYYCWALSYPIRNAYIIFRKDSASMYVSTDECNTWTSETLPALVDNNNIACLCVEDTMFYYNGLQLYKYADVNTGWVSASVTLTLDNPTIACLNDFIILAGGDSNTNQSVYRYNRNNSNWTGIAFERGARRFVVSGSDRVVTIETNTSSTQKAIRWSFNGLNWNSISISHVQHTSCFAYGPSYNGIGCWVAGIHSGGGKCTCIWWDSPLANTPSYAAFDAPANGEVESIVYNEGVWLMYINGDPAYYYNRSALPCYGTWEHASADNSHVDTRVFWCKNKFILLEDSNFTDEYNITNIDPIYQLNTTASITAKNISADNEVRLSRLEAQMNNIMMATLQTIYPIGAIYISMSPTNPVFLFGFGAWTAINNKFLFCLDQSNGFTDPTDGTTKNDSNQTGGEEKHKLVESEMPSHTHGINGQSVNPGAGTWSQYGNYPVRLSNDVAFNWSSISGLVAYNTGGNQSHNNIPPFMTVFAWQRIA